jgi:hypothetical protein
VAQHLGGGMSGKKKHKKQAKKARAALDAKSQARSQAKSATTRRRIFVGDVQGCGDELEDLLDKLAFSQSGDALYFVGDLINRGTRNRKVLEIAMRSARACVLGNQEYWLLQRGFFAKKPPSANDWPGLADFVSDPERERFGQWLASFPLLIDLDDILLVHAALPPALWKKQADPSPWTLRGYSPKRPLTEDELFLIHARNCDKRGRRPTKDWPYPKPPFLPWYEHYEGSQTVVFGHWARHGLVRKKRIRGLDSGCVYGGQLSAWIAETDELIQVPARRAYWPR